jgi:hypothetical protein
MAALSAVEIIGIICMVEWGLIHIAAFFMMKGAWHDDIRSVYNAYDELMGVKEYKDEYDNVGPPGRMQGKVLWQHALNLGWAGAWSGIVVPIYLANHNREAWMMSLVPYLVDWGYFMAFDWFHLGGKMAQAQTYIVSIGSIMCAISVNTHHVVPQGEFIVMIIIPSLLIFFGILEKLSVTDYILKCFGMKTRADYDAMGPRNASAAVAAKEVRVDESDEK